MTEEKEEETGFVVKDKRRFSASGELRKEEGQEAPPKEAASPTAKDAPSSSLSEPLTSGESVPSEAQTDGGPGFSMKEGYQAGPDQLDFSSFVLSLATQALMQLGEMPAPDGVSIPKNPDAARQTIDIVGMLEEKTKGNLTAHEETLMKEILHNLRLSYVKCSR